MEIYPYLILIVAIIVHIFKSNLLRNISCIFFNNTYIFNIWYENKTQKTKMWIIFPIIIVSYWKVCFISVDYSECESLINILNQYLFIFIRMLSKHKKYHAKFFLNWNYDDWNTCYKWICIWWFSPFLKNSHTFWGCTTQFPSFNFK